MDKVYVNTGKKTRKINNQTYGEEVSMECFSTDATGRSLYVSIEKVREISEDVADRLENEEN